MSDKIFVSELKEGMPVESIFLCTHKALLKDKNGKPYLNLKLTDRTGEIEARVWERANHWVDAFDKLDYLRVKGHVVSFQERLQFNVMALEALAPEFVSPEDFLPHTSHDIEGMYQELLELCRKNLRHPAVRSLLFDLLENSPWVEDFKKSPAAKSNHHAWVGGLLEHVLKLCQVAVDILKHYPQADADLVLAGLILHDFGKVEELSADRVFEYTDKGQLVGHLTISVEILLKAAARQEDFPPRILHHLMHIILSHHGHLEYGSPKEPMTLEALLVHQLDHLDSKLQAFQDSLARETSGDSRWSSAGFVFKRPLYKATASDMSPDSSPQTTEKKSTPKPSIPKTDVVPPENRNDKKEASAESNKTSKETQDRPSQQSKEEHRPHRVPHHQPLGTNLGELLSAQLKKN